MQSVHKILIRVLVLGAAICGTTVFLQAQQRKAPLMNPGSAPVKAGKSLEFEIVEIQRSAALPDHIRHSGKFILLLVNHTSEPNAVFVLDSASAGEARRGPHLLRWGGPGGWSSGHASSAIIDQATGEYQLKSLATGAVLCTITAE